MLATSCKMLWLLVTVHATVLRTNEEGLAEGGPNLEDLLGGLGGKLGDLLGKPETKMMRGLIVGHHQRELNGKLVHVRVEDYNRWGKENGGDVDVRDSMQSPPYRIHESCLVPMGFETEEKYKMGNVNEWDGTKVMVEIAKTARNKDDFFAKLDKSGFFPNADWARDALLIGQPLVQLREMVSQAGLRISGLVKLKGSRPDLGLQVSAVEFDVPEFQGMAPPLPPMPRQFLVPLIEVCAVINGKKPSLPEVDKDDIDAFNHFADAYVHNGKEEYGDLIERFVVAWKAGQLPVTQSLAEGSPDAASFIRQLTEDSFKMELINVLVEQPKRDPYAHLSKPAKPAEKERTSEPARMPNPS